MASLNMNGPYSLDEPTIDAAIRKESAGNFVLGSENKGTFEIEYVGRSDSDLNAALKEMEEESECPKFKFSYADSAEEAFEKECHLYHDIDPHLNEGHPERPDQTHWECPRCDIY